MQQPFEPFDLESSTQATSELLRSSIKLSEKCIFHELRSYMYRHFKSRRYKGHILRLVEPLNLLFSKKKNTKNRAVLIRHTFMILLCMCIKLGVEGLFRLVNVVRVWQTVDDS